MPVTAPDGASRAVIVTVDDPGASLAVARDLRRRCGELHRSVRAESGEVALHGAYGVSGARLLVHRYLEKL